MKNYMKMLIIGAGTAIVGAGTAVAEYTANYSTNDMSAIVVDNLGTAGVEFKTYMPLFILGIALGLLVTAYVKLKHGVNR